MFKEKNGHLRMANEPYCKPKAWLSYGNDGWQNVKKSLLTAQKM